MDSNQSALARELVDCLNRQAEGLNQFLELLSRQRDALVARNPRDVDRVTRELEQALTTSQKLEQARKTLTAKLSACLQANLVPGDAAREAGTLSELSLLVAASEASELASVQTRLRSLHREMDRRRRLNSALIEESLRCTGETLQWIAQSRVRPSTYSHPGGKPSAQTQLAVNRRC
jgi:flagellar FlgN protein